MTYTAAIRQRGQITIPRQIRADLPWLKSGSVIHVSRLDDQSLLVKPYQKEAPKKVDWEQIENNIALLRSFKGKRGNLSAFIAKDRERH